jgi:hypothetical protein
MNIRLSFPLAILLQEVAKKYEIDTSVIIKKDGTWQLNPEDQERLVEAISSEFTETGLKLNSEPNNRGLQLEELLDRINLRK